jgi:hypothetical protein
VLTSAVARMTFSQSKNFGRKVLLIPIGHHVNQSYNQEISQLGDEIQSLVDERLGKSFV